MKKTQLKPKCGIFALLTILAVTLALTGCVKPVKNPPPSTALTIGVAGFTQPETTADMLAGYMSEHIQRVDPKVFDRLDSGLITALQQKSSRSYISSTLTSNDCQKPYAQGDTRQAALKYWINVGNCMGVDLLIVPQVIEWQEREGGELGVTKSAAVVMDFFLIDVKNKNLIARSRYEEKQQDLSSNLLNAGKFVNRGGKWVSAEDLAKEGMAKAVKDFSL